MSIDNGRDGHLQDGELAQLLDREAMEPNREAWVEHVARCLACEERLGELDQASVWLRENVAVLDEGVAVDELARARALAAVRKVSVTPARPRFGVARAAAVAAFLVLGGLSVEPVRAWVFAGLERFVAEPAEPVRTEVAARSAGARVSFLPTERVFAVELDQAQAAGVVSIRMIPGNGATAQVLDGRDESLSVLPAALLVENSAESRASYEIALPDAIIRTVRVTVAGQVIDERLVTGETGPVVVDLATAEAR